MRATRALAALRPIAPELALAAAIVAGWACVTIGIAGLAPARIVWPLSIGLLLLTLAGWGALRDLAALGLYGLLITPTPRAQRGKT